MILSALGLMMIGGSCKSWTDKYITFSRIANLIASLRY